MHASASKPPSCRHPTHDASSDGHAKVGAGVGTLCASQHRRSVSKDERSRASRTQEPEGQEEEEGRQIVIMRARCDRKICRTNETGVSEEEVRRGRRCKSAADEIQHVPVVVGFAWFRKQPLLLESEKKFVLMVLSTSCSYSINVLSFKCNPESDTYLKIASISVLRLEYVRNAVDNGRSRGTWHSSSFALMSLLLALTGSTDTSTRYSFL